MSATITKNEQFGSVEVSFDTKPSQTVRDALKALRFRWHNVKKVWYGRATVEQVRAAIGETDNAPAEEPRKAGKPSGTPQDHVKIYWNGIKIDGGELVRCSYSIDNNKDRSESLSIYARDYADLPRDLLPVENNSDSYTDYFENDRAYITPEHPLYKYFRYAALKARARSARKYLPDYEKTLASPERFHGSHSYAKRQAEACRDDIAAFDAATDPGQPTAEDLEKIDMQRQAEENEKRQQEIAEDQRQRELALCMKCNGLRFIGDTMEAHPWQEGQPKVQINWSEHPALGTFQEDSLYMSVAAAEIILGTLDKEQRETRETVNGIGWYWKTKFHILGEYDGEPLSYEGRYDLGDNDGGLVQHIRALGEWERTHDVNGHSIDHPKEINDRIRFADWLEQFTAKEA